MRAADFGMIACRGYATRATLAPPCAASSSPSLFPFSPSRCLAAPFMDGARGVVGSYPPTAHTATFPSWGLHRSLSAPFLLRRRFLSTQQRGVVGGGGGGDVSSVVAATTEQTLLSNFCVGHFAGLKASLEGLVVSDLGGYTEEKLMNEVQRAGGSRLLVPPFLMQRVGGKGGRTLESFLKPSLPTTPQGRSPKLDPFDLSMLCKPLEIKSVEILHDDPQWCASETWLPDRCAEIIAQAQTTESESNRKAPMALVRCSRGGKTRALYELNRELRERHPDVAVIYISLNGFSSLEPWELRDDPVQAFCRRIAFRASAHYVLNDHARNGAMFQKFLYNIQPQHITSWLGETPCILMIDELNVLDLVGDKEGIAWDRAALGMFLRSTFLYPSGRLLVFSSHVLPQYFKFFEYLESSSMSERPVLVRDLPLIDSLASARIKLNYPALTASEALFRGRIPALIWYIHHTGRHFPKRDAAIRSVTWSDATVRSVLQSFLNGDANMVPRPLWQLMTTSCVKEEVGVSWVPVHLAAVLQGILMSASVSHELHALVNSLLSLLFQFDAIKTSNGYAWESLFVIVLVIRAIVGAPHTTLMPAEVDWKRVALSFDKPWRQPESGKSLADALSWDSDVEPGLVDPLSFPHVTVFFPKQASFAVYDLFLVVFTAPGEKGRVVYGYQLRQGSELPSEVPSKKCAKSIVVRGIAAINPRPQRNGWYVASDAEIDDFLGVTGRALAPKEWREVPA